MPKKTSARNDEVSELVAASGLVHAEVAAALSRATSRSIQTYVIGRMISGARSVKSDEMDALRELARPGFTAPQARENFSHQLTEHSEFVPLYSASARLGAKMMLSEECRVGALPIHPSQRGYRSAFDFIQGDDRLGDLVRRGFIVHVVRDVYPQPGMPCLVEKEDGECYARIFVGEDANTVFLKVLKPKEADEQLPRRDVKQLHRITGVTFGGA